MAMKWRLGLSRDMPALWFMAVHGARMEKGFMDKLKLPFQGVHRNNCVDK